MKSTLIALALTFAVEGIALPALADTENSEAKGEAEAELVGPTAEDAKADMANWRAVDPERLFIFETTKGRILIEAFPDVAPKHYEQFSNLIRSGDYDGTTFHRVLNGFMAQGGDIFALHGRESGLPDIPGEFTFQRDPAVMPLDAAIGPLDSSKHGYINGFPIQTQPQFLAEMSASGMVETYSPHCRGVVSTARTTDPDSAKAQFFLMRDHSPHLDRAYTAWGRVVEGERTVLKIKAGPKPDGTVKDPDILTSAKVAADLPADSRPQVWVMRTDGPAFIADLVTKGEVPVCDLSSVAAVVEG